MRINTDVIHKQILLKASLERVWRAISDSSEFGTWFGMRLEGPFVVGEAIRGCIVPTAVDAEVAAMQKPYEGKLVEFVVEAIVPQTLFSLRWHPFAIEEGVDYSAEPMTLIEFVLAEADGGVLLTLTESGFDQIPLERRARAFAANDGGWTMQMVLIEKYLSYAA